MKGASLKLHTPQLMSPVSQPRPHGHYATVLKADDKFQFYYRGDTKPGNHWKKGWEQYHEGEVTLYSESKDAINWTLPRLGIYDDHIARVVEWKGGSDISALAGKPVRLRFEMLDADLYSLSFHPG